METHVVGGGAPLDGFMTVAHTLVDAATSVAEGAAAPTVDVGTPA